MRPPTRHPFGAELRPGNRRKIKGMNNVMKTVDRTSAITPGYGWHTMWTTGWDWEGWQRPNIDLAAALGPNLVKTTSSLHVFVENDPTTVAAVTARMRQWLDYTLGKGLLVYWNCGTPQEFGSANTAQAQQALATICGIVDDYPHVIGFDLINEFNGGPTLPNLAYKDTFTMGQLISAAKGATRLPVTMSMSMHDPTEWHDFYIERLFDTGADFHDFHPYYDPEHGDPVSADLTTYRASRFYLPWFIGEIGQLLSAGTAAQTSRMQAIGLLAQEPDCMGAIAFCLTDYDGTGQRWGFYPEDRSAVRAQLATPFATWPTATGQ